MSYKDVIKRKQLSRQIVTVAKVVTGTLDTLPTGSIGGVDTDLYAGPFSFTTLWARGGRFAYIRAGQNAWVDPQFHYSWLGSKGVLKRGLYWYLDKTASINMQARLLCSLFPNGYDGELPLALDLEQDVNVKVKGQAHPDHLSWADALSFIEVLHAGWPSWTGNYVIYTNWSWWVNFGSTDPVLANRPLWFAAPGETNPAVPDPWKSVGWSLQQISFAGNGPLYGTLASPGRLASKGIDLDIASPSFAQAYGI